MQAVERPASRKRREKRGAHSYSGCLRTKFPELLHCKNLHSISVLPFDGRSTIFLASTGSRYSVEHPRCSLNVHISYRLHKTPAVEKDIHHQVEKLRKRLQVFRPELIHLKGMVEEISSREGFGVSLNLRLPSGQMAVEEKLSLIHICSPCGLR